MILIKCENLKKSFYYNESPFHAIENCNMEIQEGEFAAICGNKGSGKSTLLRLLGGYDRATSGSVYINGENITGYDDDRLSIMRRQNIGYLTKNDSLIPELTVHENIILPLLLAKTACIQTHYKMLTDMLQITDILNRYPRQLLRNQIQSVVYVRTLIRQPNIILMDDPNIDMCRHLDRDLIEYLADLTRKQGRTLIIATNDPEITSLADHVIKLKRGTVIEDVVQ